MIGDCEMTLDEAKLNFGRAAVFTSADGLVTERGEISGVWGQYVQILVGQGHLKLVDPDRLSMSEV